MFVAITSSPRDYAWGSTSAIAGLLGRRPSGLPEAELWLGAHPGSPSTLLGEDAPAATLADWVAADPDAVLGADAIAEHGPRLPFLLKVLAAAAPLSLQAHPSPAQALAGFARENAAGIRLDAPERNYKDAFHKPELIVALSERFEALCGFRAPAEVRAILAALRAADAESAAPDPAPLQGLEARLSGPDGLRSTVQWLLGADAVEAGEVARLVERVLALAASDTLAGGEFAREFATVRGVADAYPGDPGIVLTLLLNRVTLRPGEALYLPAGNIHAYLDGLGIELMAASDNVLRGGLTPKHIDVDELLDVLSFEPVPVPLMVPENPHPGALVYRPDVADFVLHSIERSEGQEPTPVALAGPAIALCTAGRLQLTGAHGGATLERGESCFITPDEGDLRVGGAGTLFIATVG
ncbi:mannose-6-phosphate isomerase, class I [Microterricola pindariensis]|uniref:mannose-6-phosphate isomerase n=1 Tax=Microterricola pindariensis TaxID=478010 RepID=A0ABX5AZ67_9MICO|nr:mannose-6-phosphate isomerase, class I [Microterricola pindariensis]PPL20185.1 mannose-6-phosphate isomerase, class I [Microterricola pindariensis]